MRLYSGKQVAGILIFVCSVLFLVSFIAGQAGFSLGGQAAVPEEDAAVIPDSGVSAGAGSVPQLIEAVAGEVSYTQEELQNISV